MQSRQSEPEPSHRFSDLLSTLIAPGQKSAQPWDENADEDVVTLSYENALRRHARYRPPEPDFAASAELPQPEAVLEPSSDLSEDSPARATVPVPIAPAGAVTETSASAGQAHKTASITIRLTQAEYEQLRARAAEAGLTISAYLRSCTFEAESLRALVKDTLARFKAGAPTDNPKAARHGRFPRWLKGIRLWSRPDHRRFQA